MSARTMYDAFISAGMTPEGACAMLGNFKAESALRANNVEDRSGIKDEDYTAKVDNDPSYDFATDYGSHYGFGLAQWTLPGRKRKLRAFAKQHGVSIGDEDMQVQFAVKELKDDFPSLWKLLTTSHDLFACTQQVCNVYENPAVKNVGTRYEYAQQFYKEFASVKPKDPVAATFPPDATVIAFQMWMQYNGYWPGEITGYKSKEFFAKLREFVNDMEAC